MSKWLRRGALALLCIGATLSLGAAIRHDGILDYAVAAAGVPLAYVAYRLSRTLDAEAPRALGPGLRLAIAWLTTLFGLLFIVSIAALAVVGRSEPIGSWPIEYVLLAGIVAATGAVAGVGVIVLRGAAPAWAFSVAYVGAMSPSSVALDRIQRSFGTSDWLLGLAVFGLLAALTAQRAFSEARLTSAST